MAATPIYNAGGVSGSSGNTCIYANVTLTGSMPSVTAGTGLTYGYASATSAGSMWTTTLSEPYYSKQPKVKITDSDIELDGLSLRDSMQAIKNELMIPTRLTRNTKLEAEFAELQAAAEQYYELERKFLDQKKMWETLKHTDK